MLNVTLDVNGEQIAQIRIRNTDTRLPEESKYHVVVQLDEKHIPLKKYVYHRRSDGALRLVQKSIAAYFQQLASGE